MATWGLSPWAVDGVGICQGSEWTEELGGADPSLVGLRHSWAPSKASAWPCLEAPVGRARVQGLGARGPLQHESRVRQPRPAPPFPTRALCVVSLPEAAPSAFLFLGPTCVCAQVGMLSRSQPHQGWRAGPCKAFSEGDVRLHFSSFYTEAWEKNKSEKHFQK